MRKGLSPTPIVVAWSGGKDAAWTLHRLQRDPAWSVCGLLTQVSRDSGRIGVHGLGHALLQAQADAIALPVIEVPLPDAPDNNTYETAFASGLRTLQARWPTLRHIAFGDLLLADIRAWREALCARHGWTSLFPLFGSDTRLLAREMIDAGLQATLCCVDREQLDARFVGRAFDSALLRDLPAGIDACGENGEFHTGVSAGPMFRAALQVERVMMPSTCDDRFAYCDLQPVTPR